MSARGADRDLRSLRFRRPRRPSTKAPDRKPASAQVFDEGYSLTRFDPPEQQALRQPQQIRREAMPAHMRREPQRLRFELLAERVVKRPPEPRTARVAPPVPTDKRERLVDRLAAASQVQIGNVVVGREPKPPRRPHVRAHDERRELVPAPIRPPNEQCLRPRRRIEPRPNRRRGPLGQAVQGVPFPRAANLQQQERVRLARGARERLAGRQGRARALAHAGSGRRSARSRSSAGSMPSASAKRR